MFAGDHDCEHSRNALLQSARAAARERARPPAPGSAARGARDPHGKGSSRAGPSGRGTLTTRDPHAHGTLRARDPHEQTAAAPLGSSSDVWVPCAHDDAS